MEPNFGYFSTCWRRCPAVYGMTPAWPEGVPQTVEELESAQPMPESSPPEEPLPNPSEYPEVPEAGTAPNTPDAPVIIEPKAQIQGRKVRPEIDPWAQQPKTVSAKSTPWSLSWWKSDKPATAATTPAVSHQAAHALRVEQRNSVISQLPPGAHVTPPPRPLVTAQRPNGNGQRSAEAPGTSAAIRQSAARQPANRATWPATTRSVPRAAPISSQVPPHLTAQDPRMIGTSRAIPARAVVPSQHGPHATWSPRQGVVPQAAPTTWPTGYVMHPAQSAAR